MSTAEASPSPARVTAAVHTARGRGTRTDNTSPVAGTRADDTLPLGTLPLYKLFATPLLAQAVKYYNVIQIIIYALRLNNLQTVLKREGTIFKTKSCSFKLVWVK